MTQKSPSLRSQCFFKNDSCRTRPFSFIEPPLCWGLRNGHLSSNRRHDTTSITVRRAHLNQVIHSGGG